MKPSESLNATQLVCGIEYDGEPYAGWQWQDGEQSVQSVLEDALSRIANQAVRVIGSSRTDSGVHAAGQVAHFRCNSERRIDQWINGVNALLPQTIRVRWLREIQDDFHARFSAVSRSYVYVIDNDPAGSVRWHRRAANVRMHLDQSTMDKGLKLLLGQRDFSSFRASSCQAKSPVRTLYEAHVTRRQSLVYLYLKADGFLQKMVRNIAGALIQLGIAKMDLCDFKRLTSLGNRTAMPKTAAAHGLHFLGPAYDSKFNLPKPASPEHYLFADTA